MPAPGYPNSTSVKELKAYLEHVPDEFVVILSITLPGHTPDDDSMMLCSSTLIMDQGNGELILSGEDDH